MSNVFRMEHADAKSSESKGAAIQLAGPCSRSNDQDTTMLWDAIRALSETVQTEHERRLRRVETDLRWVMTLLGALLATIISTAVARVAG